MASNTEGGTRKLAAIMFTDVKDFSKKMSENEVAAMEVLKIHDDAMRDLVARNTGVVIKSLGDSFMVDFSSAVNAVRCAIEAQELFHKHSAGKPEFEKIQIRIGIHLGDVMTIGNDLYGDGVNIAARIEAITEPNRICVSSEIYNQVKNKMPIRAYNMGSIDLKNIAEPVEVFELLLDSIPGLSEPSESAKSHPTRRRADLVAAQEHEEATRVEAARQKVDDAQERENAEKTARANEHYAKAEEYYRAGDLTNAEEEIKEIYKVVQIHYEAQMLILQIEEQRALRDEDDRRRRVKEEKQRKEEEQKKRIEKCLDVALGFVEQEQFQEALNALQEVYTLEPNNEQAKRIEKQVQFAEEARLERQRLEALAEDDRAKDAALKAERQRAEEVAKATLGKIAAARKEQQRIPKVKIYIGIAAVVLLLLGATVTYFLTRISLRKPGTIAVLPFSAGRADDGYIGEALSAFVADEVAKTPTVMVVDPASAHVFGTINGLLQSQAAAIGITHALSGSVSVNGTSVTLKAQLFELGDEKALWETTLKGNTLDLNSLAAQASAALFKFMDIEAAPRTAARRTESAEAFDLYLRGFVLSLRPDGNSTQQAVAYLHDALRQDSTLTPAKLTLAKLMLNQYEQGRQDEATLATAFSLAREAVKTDPNNASAHAILGQAHRYLQQFDGARKEIAAGLSLQPGNAPCNRERALLSLIQGSTDEALQYAESALKTDPRHYLSHEVKGIIDLFKENYEDASRQFEQATSLGGPDSLLTVGYKFRLWVSLDQEDRIVEYCQRMMGTSDDRTKVLLHYWMGRAYSLKGMLDESNANFDRGITLAEQVVLTKDQEDVTTLATYALLQARRAKTPKRAVQAIERAMALDSGASKLHYWKARIHAIQNDKQSAIAELTKAVSLQYLFTEILDPDFLSVWQEPGFKAAIVRKN